jgi:hypothetical protein
MDHEGCNAVVRCAESVGVRAAFVAYFQNAISSGWR